MIVRTALASTVLAFLYPVATLAEPECANWGNELSAEEFPNELSDSIVDALKQANMYSHGSPTTDFAPDALYFMASAVWVASDCSYSGTVVVSSNQFSPPWYTRVAVDVEGDPNSGEIAAKFVWPTSFIDQRSTLSVAEADKLVKACSPNASGPSMNGAGVFPSTWCHPTQFFGFELNQHALDSMVQDGFLCAYQANVEVGPHCNPEPYAAAECFKELAWVLDLQSETIRCAWIDTPLWTSDYPEPLGGAVVAREVFLEVSLSELEGASGGDAGTEAGGDTTDSSSGPDSGTANDGSPQPQQSPGSTSGCDTRHAGEAPLAGLILALIALGGLWRRCAC